ncbi:MAG: helix-turn-helix transcriptional regulator [Sulfuricaulis sp.]
MKSQHNLSHPGHAPENVRSERLLRLPQVLALIPISRSEWYRRVGVGDAPQSVALGLRARAWRETEIQAYVERIITSSPKAA